MWPASCQPTKAAAEHVDHEAEEHHAFPAAHVREVGDPHLVRSAGGEVALKQVRRVGPVAAGNRRAPRPPSPLGAHDLVFAHQPLYLAARRLHALTRQGLPHPPVPVGEVVALVRRADLLQQLSVPKGARRRPAPTAVVVRQRRYPDSPRDELDRVLRALLIMNALTAAGSGRAPWRKTPRRLSESGSPHAAHGSHAPAPSNAHAPPW